MPMSNRIYKRIKRIVEAEKVHREPLDTYWEVYSKRLALLEALGEDMAETIILHKPVLKGNCSHDRPRTAQSLAQLHPGGKVELEGLLDALRPMRKMSLYKQKFHTYVYNKDKTNATKYHTRLTSYTADYLETLSEAMEDGGRDLVIGINHDINEKEGEFHKGEGGYLALANEFKVAYESREQMLKYM